MFGSILDDALPLDLLPLVVWDPEIEDVLPLRLYLEPLGLLVKTQMDDDVIFRLPQKVVEDVGSARVNGQDNPVQEYLLRQAVQFEEVEGVDDNLRWIDLVVTEGFEPRKKYLYHFFHPALSTKMSESSRQSLNTTAGMTCFSSSSSPQGIAVNRHFRLSQAALIPTAMEPLMS